MPRRRCIFAGRRVYAGALAFFVIDHQEPRLQVAHYVIMGCGRVGVSLAHTLDNAGHTVAVIDQDERAFRRLRSTFGGQ